MSKKERTSGGPGNLKVIIFNIIIAALCIVSIVTLYIGDFMKAEITLTVTKDTITKIIDSFGGSSEPQNAAIKAAEGEGENQFDMKDFAKYLDDDFSLSFSAAFVLKGDTVAKGALGQAEEAVNSVINDQVDHLVDNIAGTVDQVIEQAMKAVVHAAVDKAKDMIKEAIAKEMAENNISEEQVWARLEEYNVYPKDIDDIIDGFLNTLNDLLDGNKATSINFLKDDSETSVLYKMYRVAAEETLKSSGNEYTSEDVTAKAKEYQNTVATKFEEVLNSLSVDGEFSKETLIVSLFNGFDFGEEQKKGDNAGNKPNDQNGPANAADENAGSEEGSSDKKIKNMDDVKNYIVEMLLSKVSPEVVDMVGKALSYVGYFLFFVMACWAYVLIKIIIKTIFFKNKTVGLFFPRMFGWMPHVFFVGLPMLLIKYLPVAAAKIIESQPDMQQGLDMIIEILEMVKVSVSSLTWISALCTVILMVLLIFYWPMRRAAKRARKNK